MTTISNNDAAPWLRKLRHKAHQKYDTLQVDERQDLVQEAITIALGRGLMSTPPTWTQTGSLLIDAYRDLRKTRRKGFGLRQVSAQIMELLADAPNQITDMEAREAALSPEEQAFEDMLANETALNLAREAECRHLLGSSPLVPTDLVRLLPYQDGCSARVDR